MMIMMDLNGAEQRKANLIMQKSMAILQQRILTVSQFLLMII